MIGIVAGLAVLVVAIVYSSNKPTAKEEQKVTKVGVLQFVVPILGLDYQGIQDGLAEEGYKDDQDKNRLYNSEGGRSEQRCNHE